MQPTDPSSLIVEMYTECCRPVGLPCCESFRVQAVNPTVQSYAHQVELLHKQLQTRQYYVIPSTTYRYGAILLLSTSTHTRTGASSP